MVLSSANSFSNDMKLFFIHSKACVALQFLMLSFFSSTILQIDENHNSYHCENIGILNLGEGFDNLHCKHHVQSSKFLLNDSDLDVFHLHH